MPSPRSRQTFASVVVATIVVITGATTSQAQVRVPVVSPATSFEHAIVQIALYYDQSIGLELIDDDATTATAPRAPLDLRQLRFDDAIAAVMRSAPRAYGWQRQGNAVIVRPEGADRDAESWLNRTPGGPGVRTESDRRSGQQWTTLQRNMPPDLFEVTVSESWLELQRPGYSFMPVRPNLQHEGIWRLYPEVGRRVSVVPMSNNWDTLAAVMMAHGGVAVWTVAHPGVRAIQGDTTLEVVGSAGWWLDFPGLTPAPGPTATMVPALPEDRLWLQDALPRPELPAPPAVR